MRNLVSNKVFLSVVAIVTVGVVLLIFIFSNKNEKKPVIIKKDVEKVAIKTPFEKHEIIGKSVEGRDIEVYTYGDGDTRILFVGGIHGGYEWNTVLLAYKFIDYLNENHDFVPKGLTISIIPSANPDGIYKVIGKEGRFSISDVPEDEGPLGNGRFNANNVDLNRNFDCKWKPRSTWRGNIVSAGVSAFSEPESRALRDFILKTKPVAVVFWHSKSNAVYASECENGVLPDTIKLMDTYSKASGYKAVESFDAYPVSGDAEGWLASINIPAVTVELSTHKTIEWDKNFVGIKAVLQSYEIDK